MKATADFDVIAPDETRDLAIDFISYLQTGDSISTVAAWNCTVAEKSIATDSTPSSRLISSPTHSGTVVTQTVQGCIADVTYVMEAIVNTTLGETLSIWSYLDCKAVGEE